MSPTREAFENVGHTIIELVATITDTEFDMPGLGEWNVRELLAHTLRAYSLVGTYLDAGSVEGECANAGEYYRNALQGEAVHAQIAQRARDAATDLRDPVAQATTAITEGLARTATANDTDQVASFLGMMPFSEYLRTRLFEATLHGLDLINALGRSVTLPPDAIRLTLATLLEAGDDAKLTRILKALSGRGSLPVGFNMLQ